MCEQERMTLPGTMELARAVGISKSYASQILSDDPAQQRAPSRPLAIHIYRRTGWRHASIADLTDDQLATLETVDPWTPRQQAAA